MVKRKSPIKHRVKTHKRRGERVDSFVRGSGQRVKLANPSIIKTTESSKSKYFKYNRETLLNYPDIEKRGNYFILYHASPKRFEKDIIKYGILPRKLPKPVDDEPTFPVLYLASSRKSSLYALDEDNEDEVTHPVDEEYYVYTVKVPINTEIFEDPTVGLSKDGKAMSSPDWMFITKKIPLENIIEKW